jgi:8-oxo-dGTP diphosphatase|tara:strand:+ start:645 stop:1055 length:411 start_codon:yes stop_codon:yes gene_type:complete
MFPQVAKAIIHRKEHFLLQLRDDSPVISYPNQWSFFGGGIDPGETPWQALQRELEEELEWRADQGSFLYHWINPEHPCQIHFFAVPFTGNQKQLILHEGQAIDWFTLKELLDNNAVAPHVKQHLVNFSNSYEIQSE